jgi:hypothetical protein
LALTTMDAIDLAVAPGKFVKLLGVLREPLSTLDLKLREEMWVEISHLQRQLGIATVFARTTRARRSPRRTASP